MVDVRLCDLTSQSNKVLMRVRADLIFRTRANHHYNHLCHPRAKMYFHTTVLRVNDWDGAPSRAQLRERINKPMLFLCRPLPTNNWLAFSTLEHTARRLVLIRGRGPRIAALAGRFLRAQGTPGRVFAWLKEAHNRRRQNIKESSSSSGLPAVGCAKSKMSSA